MTTESFEVGAPGGSWADTPAVPDADSVSAVDGAHLAGVPTLGLPLGGPEAPVGEPEPLVGPSVLTHVPSGMPTVGIPIVGIPTVGAPGGVPAVGLPTGGIPVPVLPAGLPPTPLAALPTAAPPITTGASPAVSSPVIVREPAAGMYMAAGQLTADQLVNGQPGMFDHLQDRIISMRDWVQAALVERGYAERIVEARGNAEVRAEIVSIIDRLILKRTSEKHVVRGADKAILIASVINEIIGLGPIEPLWSDPRITEVMVNGPKEVHAEIDGRLILVPGAQFRDGEHLLEVCQKILQPLGRRIDLANPLEDGRLPDGSRTNIVHSAIAPEGPYLTIRRFPDTVWTLKDLVEINSLDTDMACWLAFLINHKCSAIVVGGTGSGKALDVDTLIPTLNGFTRMGDLTIGSVIFDDTGELTEVTGVYDQAPDRACYEVVFSDGSVIVADGDHLWETTTADGVTAVRDTTEILSTLRTASHHLNHRVRVAAPVQFPEKDLPVDPYLIGAWFGGEVILDDGELDESTDQERIPSEYLRSHEKQRASLLSGLMDAAGTITGAGTVQFTSENTRLCRDVHTLVASLGYVPSLTPTQTKVVNGDRPAWVVTWDAPDGVFTGHGKSAALAASQVESVPGAPRYRFISLVRPVESRPVRCIMVDSPTRLYLAGETFIPTHNTSLLNALSSAIDRGERVATIEDALELRMHPSAHVLRLEARPPSAGGMAEITIRDLVKNSLRMRPDRVIVGEVRDGAALDMLTAMNTGHEGSMTTVHANGANEAVRRLEVLVAQGAEGIGAAAVKWLISDAVDLFIVQRRYEDGSRRVSGIYEIPVLSSATDELVPIPLWEWEQTGVEAEKFVGSYVKRNDISASLRERRRLDMFPMATWEDVLRMSEVPAALQRKG
ncbi:ATPase, T2SS/T4P/T4SS family [Tessaracoccus sp.]